MGKRVSKSLIILFIALPIVSYGANYTLTSANYDIKVNGQKIAVQPLNHNGSTYLPLRAISEAVGVPIAWDNATRSVEIETLDINKLKESCVMIKASDGATYSQGSAVCWDYGEYLTAYHVIDEGRNKITILADGTELTKGEVNTSIDIATLKTNNEVKPVKIGDSDEVKVGDKVMLITSPKGKENTASYGTVLEPDNKRIVVQCKLGAGASGGAVFSMQGELVGILIAGDGETDEYDTKYLITPINTIRKAL